MDSGEIIALITGPESDRFERKAALSEPDRIREAICAFSNNLADNPGPGVVAIGLDDRGKPTGLDISDQLLQDLAAMRDDGKIAPIPSMTVQTIQVYGCGVAVVIVEPSAYPPVQVRGRCWIRVGPRRAVATIEETQRLVERRRNGTLPFDARAAHGATLDDVNRSTFRHEVLPQLVSREFLAVNGRTELEQLQAVGFADADQRPTNVGLLISGTDPSSAIPGAYFHFLRFEGTGLDDPVRVDRRVTGVVQSVILAVEDLVRANIETSVEFIGAAEEARRPSLPFSAIQQLVRNALIHRSYENTAAPARMYWFTDRVEIHSPGGPFGQVNAENFGKPGITDYRNPNLASKLATLGFVQQFGAGLEIARKELARNGNPEPTFECGPTSVACLLRFA